MKKWLQKISVTKKLGFMMILTSIAVGIGTLLAIGAMMSLNKEFDTFEAQSYQGVKAVLETEKELNYFSRITREIMLGGDLDENLAKLDATRQKILSHFKETEAACVDSSQKMLQQQAQKDAMVFITASSDLMYTLKSQNKSATDLYPYYHHNFSPMAKASRKSMERLVESKTKEASTMQETFKHHIVIWSILAGIGGVVMITALGLVMLMIVSQIKDSLSKTQNGLVSFFQFLGGEQEKAALIPDLGNDEFGRLAIEINRNIEILEKKFAEQRQSIVDFAGVSDFIGKGLLYNRISTHYSDTNLNALADSLNKMVDEIERTFADLIAIMTKIANGDYSKSVSAKNALIGGSFASIMNAANSMATSNSEIFAVIAKFSREFNSEATALSSSGDELSTSANQQASSLEETAAAIEELTSNVAANTAKADEMTRVAQEAKNAAEKGNKVAHESLNAMGEIVSATEAIHHAVEIIENIAFQTNILSLNAAVEAATAGDAGKGFAVVAQEVRNLANRSAEAAKQIQELARTARDKSRGGLETSQNMMDSFSLISQKIVHTDNMVRDVANASREQMAGINQINDAVSQLDQMTQQNAKTASNVAEIAGEIVSKTEQFELMLSRIRYDKEYEARTCDTQLLFDTAKLKLDHITFKENNYGKIKASSEPWRVTGHHDCALGKWIDEHKHMPYASTPQWHSMLLEHEQVHKGVQSLIDADAANESNERIYAISDQIEKATLGVFEGLDHVKSINCLHSRER
ncbi:methyl-accepting chemotaxis protein [Sulfuricurvum sp.]|uniref:methyl-accepting chemotaxis protein n=1 Tax=Sulfuricurvum sp. TaxID=2025608 RepID=UPI0025EA0C69|nr:methyl-accepting chemotaxis protein [Sulfuricurvum sp.]